MYLWKVRRYQIRVVLWLAGILISVTIAQWLHELDHIVVALFAGAPIKEVKYWPPWDQHVVAVYPSQSWLVLGFLGGFLITVVPFLELFILFASRKSKWAYALIFPLFQTVPTSQGDLAEIMVVTF